MKRQALLERYEMRGDERDFLAAKRLYEEALDEGSDARLFLEYGYLLECHARYGLRRAVERYQRAVELDPDADKPHYQLIHALAALGDMQDVIERYRARATARPDDVRSYRFLASAYLADRRYERARDVIDAGLQLAPNDRMLIALRGKAAAETGDPERALADWRQAVALDDSDIWPLYSSAFLFERESRLAEAVQTWRSIVAWCEQHGAELAAEYPRRELDRLRQSLGSSDG